MLNINRRIYQSLREMVHKQSERGYTLAQEIALGEARCEVMSKRNISQTVTCCYYHSCPIDPPSVGLKLPRNEADLATTLWNSGSSTSLNPYQRKAVELALSNKFVMIQGPPGKQEATYSLLYCINNLHPSIGTGKSVTGAHIAYALAMKLKIDTARRRRGTNEPSPCVMYCGPSQQSVNVVLSEYPRIEFFFI